jgi:hypothetical protein
LVKALAGSNVDNCGLHQLFQTVDLGWRRQVKLSSFLAKPLENHGMLWSGQIPIVHIKYQSPNSPWTKGISAGEQCAVAVFLCALSGWLVSEFFMKETN